MDSLNVVTSTPAGLDSRFIIDLEHGKETVQTQKVIDVLNLLGLELIIRKR